LLGLTYFGVLWWKKVAQGLWSWHPF
jgi:hypothetical protein